MEGCNFNFVMFHIQLEHNSKSLFLFQLFTRYFSQPIKCIFHGSVEFTFSIQALGERFSLTFHANRVVGKAQLGGKHCSHLIAIYFDSFILLYNMSQCVYFYFIFVIASLFLLFFSFFLL